MSEPLEVAADGSQPGISAIDAASQGRRRDQWWVAVRGDVESTNEHARHDVVEFPGEGLELRVEAQNEGLRQMIPAALAWTTGTRRDLADGAVRLFEHTQFIAASPGPVIEGYRSAVRHGAEA